MATPSKDPLLDTTVGGCLILEVIGHGGMGVIYKARQKSLDRIVALKVLAPHLINDFTFVSRFQHEARSIARINHPNILAVYDVGEDQNVNYMIMELIDGSSLAEYQTDRHGALPFEEATNFIKQAAQGLEAAQASGIIHRDIKPENLMVTKKGIIKVSDFGLAKEADASNTSVDAVMGTPAFMSPEQCDGKKVDGRSDIYSLGGTFYRLLTGRLPFEAETAMSMMYRHKHEALIPPHEIIPTLPVPISQVVVKMMAKKREQRYQTMTEVLDAIDSALKPVPESKVVPQPQVRSHVPPNPQAVLAAPSYIPIEPASASRMQSLDSNPNLGLPGTLDTGFLSRKDSLGNIPLRGPGNTENTGSASGFGGSVGRVPVPPGNIGLSGSSDSSGRMNPPSGLFALHGMAAPEDAYGNVTRGDEMLARGDRVNALKCYRLALNTNTLDAATRERVLAEISKEVMARRQAADSLLKRGLLLEASRECRIVVEIDPQDEETKTLLKDIESKLATRRTVENEIRTALAASEFEKAIRIWDATPSELRTEALSRQIDQLRNKVIPALKLTQQAGNFHRQGRLEEAVSSYEDALKINEACEPARMGLKEVQQKVQRIDFMLKEGYQFGLERDYVKAVETLKPILLLRPGHPQAVKNIVDACVAHAQNLRAQGDFEGAWDFYKTALETSPGSPSLKRAFEDLTNSRDKELALMDRAQEAAAHGRISEAIRYLKDVLQSNPSNKKAAQQLQLYSSQRSRSVVKLLVILLVLAVLSIGSWQYLQEQSSLQATRKVLQDIHEAPSMDNIYALLKQMPLTRLTQELNTQFFIFYAPEANQSRTELQRWGSIYEGLALADEKKYTEAQRILTDQIKQLSGKEHHHLSRMLLLQVKDWQLVQLQNDALLALTAIQWKKASETFSEMKSEIEKGPAPEHWKVAEADIQEKINLLQKIIKGESFENSDHKQEAFIEYTSAQIFQNRQKLPGVDDWLAMRIKAVGFDRTHFDAALKSARASLQLRAWRAAETALRDAAELNPSAEINALQTMAADALNCDKQEMSIVISAKILSGGNYTRQNVFCVDRYEWPNKKGAIPLAGMSLVQAKDECRKVGKRLCLTQEWVEACMGDENNGWPYGKIPDKTACNTDGNAVVASGSAEKCKNAIGIYDMSGNLAEWTDSGTTGVGAQVNSVGGAFDSPARTSGCQDSFSHNPSGAANIGFRCCLTPKDPETKP